MDKFGQEYDRVLNHLFQCTGLESSEEPMPSKAIFTKEELYQIALLCRIGAEAVSVVDDAVVLKVWKKISPQLNDAEKQDIDEAVQMFLCKLAEHQVYDEEPVADVRLILEKAIETGARVRIRYYIRSRDESSERTIRPATIERQGEFERVRAWCELRAAERHFRLDCIEQILQVINDPT